jgi:ribosomal protein S18 acetylase RimI-like enzyme
MTTSNQPQAPAIRPARQDDEAFLVSLMPRLAEFPVPAWRSTDEIARADRHLLHDALTGVLLHSAVLVAELSPGGERAGYVFATTKHDYFTGVAHAHVEAIAVTPEAERRGVARALMDAIETWARRRGYTWVTLNVFDGNTRARALYDSLGYQVETVQYRKTL